MKLFGGKGGGSRQTSGGHHPASEHKKSPSQGAKRACKKHYPTPKEFWLQCLNGKQRGAILLVLSLLLLAGAVACAVQLFIQPPDRTNSGSTSTGQTGEDVEGDKESSANGNVVPVIDPETNEEVMVEFEAPGSNKEGFYNILVVGTDGDGTRTDTIMIARMDAVNDTVALMSIPRDTLINSSCSVPKINGVYGNYGGGEDGIEALESHLKSILGFEVDGYVMVDLEAFAAVVDLVDGVPFDVPVNMYYNDPTQNLYINIAAGYQVLDGQTALEMVRYRSYAEADIARTRVQQDFLQALALQCLKVGNLTKVNSFAKLFAEYVETDLTVGNMVYFGKELLECDFENMYTVTLPGQSVNIKGLDYYGLYANQVLEIVNEHFNPYDTDIAYGSLYIRSGVGEQTASVSAVTSDGASTSGDNEEEEQEVVEPVAPDLEVAPDGGDSDVTTEEAEDILPQEPEVEEPPTQEEPSAEDDTPQLDV